MRVFLTSMKSFLWSLTLLLGLVSSCKKQGLVEEILPSPVPSKKYIIAIDSNARTFVQRSKENLGTLVFSASLNQEVARAEIKFEAYFEGSSTNWQALKLDNGQARISGKFELPGGGYYPRVALFDVNNNKLYDTLFLKHFSVGEVFAVVGHSLAEGQSPYHLQDFNKQWSMVDLWPNNGEIISGPAFWGRTADYLRERLKCPILIYNTGIGGSNSLFWGNSANGLAFESKLFDWKKRQPFIFFENKIKQDILKTGIRAVLVLHGENDAGLSANAIIQHTKDYTLKIRTLLNSEHLGFCFAKSAPNFADLKPYQGVFEAQGMLFKEIPNSFEGPDLFSIKDRWDNIHFNYVGLEKAASAWNQALTDDFFKKSIPVLSQK